MESRTAKLISRAFLAITLLFFARAVFGQNPVLEIPFESLRILEQHGSLTTVHPDAALHQAQVVVLDGIRPVGIFARDVSDGVTTVFRSDSMWSTPDAGARCRAWLLLPRYEAGRANLPEGVDLLATVDTVGPGMQTIWLSSGTAQGLKVGDRLWLMPHDQPLASVRVEWAGAELMFGRCTPLADGSQLRIGDGLRLWPRPSDQAADRCRSAICFVEQGPEAIIWVAAPPGITPGPEPRLDLFADGQYVGYALVERRDDRFWYARPLLEACVRRPQVGDEALVRTPTDVRSRRFVARVFQQTSEGYLITASDADGLKPSEVATASRAGRELGLVRVTRVQSGYAAVRPVGELAEPIQNFDEIRFRPRPAEPAPMAEVEQVFGDSIFTAHLRRDDALGSEWLAVRQGTETIGAAQILVRDGESAVAVVLPATRTGILRSGAELFSTGGK